MVQSRFRGNPTRSSPPQQKEEPRRWFLFLGLILLTGSTLVWLKQPLTTGIYSLYHSTVATRQDKAASMTAGGTAGHDTAGQDTTSMAAGDKATHGAAGSRVAGGSMQGEAGPSVAVVKLRTNGVVPPAEQHRVSRQRLEQLLGSRYRLDCPVCWKLGFPLVLVPTKKRPLITLKQPPHAQLNHLATRLAITEVTGFAPYGEIVGNCYALRLDGKNFTVDEWARLDDTGIELLLLYYKEGNGVTEEDFANKRRQVAGALKVEDPGPYVHSREQDDG